MCEAKRDFVRLWKVFAVLATVIILGLWGTAKLANAETMLLDFSADWCGPCRQMTPVVDQLEREGYAIRRIDFDRERDFAAKMEVSRIPCFIIIESNGSEPYQTVDKVEGTTTLERLKAKLRKRDKKPADGKMPQVGQQPSPAWRYEQPVAYRAAVVRIYCQDDVRTRSIGSGVLVRWAGRIVVLTARHVVKDAKSITVALCNKKVYRATVLKVDATWDCAVLEIHGLPGDVSAVDVQLGNAAVLRDGDRLESCGYGPDGKMAVNSGLFLSYKRSAETPNGPDDWFEISGKARQGDSGGPIFNGQGHVVGVLWGTNGQVVVGVQAGRLHVLLDAATGQKTRQQSLVTRGDGSTIDVKNYTLLQYQLRQPTPPKAEESIPLPGPLPYQPYQPYVEPTAGASGGSLIPWRRNTEETLAEIEKKLDAIANQRQPIAPPIADPRVDSLAAELSRQRAEAEKPKGNALEQKLDAFLEKLPIQGKLAKLEERQLESGNPLERFFGAATAIVFLTTVATLGLVCLLLLGHKIYQAAHAHKADIDAKLSNAPHLQAAFDKLDGFNTDRIEPQLQKVLAPILAKLNTVQQSADVAAQQATQTAAQVAASVPNAMT